MADETDEPVRLHRNRDGDVEMTGWRSPDERITLTGQELARFLRQVKNGDFDAYLGEGGDS